MSETPSHSVDAVPRISGLPALAALLDLAGASIAAGVIARRRPVVGFLERVQADNRSLRRLHGLRQRYGRGPVELAIPGRRIVAVLDADDVGAVLAATPTPFDPASWEKRAALRQFQPHAVLITRGAMRGPRRVVNETALDTAAPLHRLAGPFSAVIAAETAELLTSARRTGGFDAAQFTRAWWRVVRQVVLGPSARDDDAVTDDLWRLRKAANWSFAAAQHTRRRSRFFERLHRYAENPAPESLLGALSAIPAPPGVDPIGQLPHWLFAFDAAGMATIRAAALLASRPRLQSRCEVTELDTPAVRPFLRSAVLESVRLWPTTPAILRETTQPTEWRDGTLVSEGGAAVLICVPAFHRDSAAMPFANSFEPDIWLDGRAERYPQLVPFSAGPAACPGQNLVLFTGSTLLAHLFGTSHLELTSPRGLPPDGALPLTLNQFGLEFAVHEHRPAITHGRV
ncbi:cytochrome P450 [Mycolicibacterium cosmeticum]|uniref:Cytochrome P450 monooxygenase n=1 Tax=Mycolicibacterium cosmeticum TaxID=258533 RepID=W9B2T8_MYCCO|nr:cytochrome P450 [Mycolicibacterium cosmeticum]TLH68414.1 cytochrome P450 [Mycolicibacterium cosmeticum]CDO09101.1 cytochrome P450 monooxygenase [Mycolicibacterium cosmeticum]